MISAAVKAISDAWSTSTRSSISSSKKGKGAKSAQLPVEVPSDSESDDQNEEEVSSNNDEGEEEEDEGDNQEEIDPKAAQAQNPTSDSASDTSSSEDEETVIDKAQVSEAVIIPMRRSVKDPSQWLPSKGPIDPRVPQIEPELAAIIDKQYHMAILRQRPPRDLTLEETVEYYGDRAGYKAAKAHARAFARGMCHRLGVTKQIPKGSKYYEESDHVPTPPVKTKSSKGQNGQKRKTPSSARAPSPPNKRANSKDQKSKSAASLGEFLL